MTLYDIAIIGGGLAGLTAATILARAGFRLILFEQHAYPQEKVCGEYVSNEVSPYLRNLGLYPHSLSPVSIQSFLLSSSLGQVHKMPLPLGGFGISRAAFDSFLYAQAKAAGGRLLAQTRIVAIERGGNHYRLQTRCGEAYAARLVLGAWGKRSLLDAQLQRSFMQHRAPFVGIKYHVRGSFAPDTVALHAFRGGYCGISPIESGRWNVCYLVRREKLRKAGSVQALEKQLQQENSQLRMIWQEAEFLSEKPLVINEISFRAKTAAESGILMLGDTAGLISPLCGNGMAMAIRTGGMAAHCVLQHWEKQLGWQERLQQVYKKAWQKEFARRMQIGRLLQAVFLKGWAAEPMRWLMYQPALARRLIRLTHGQAFDQIRL